MKRATQAMKQVATDLGSQYTLMLIDERWSLYRDLGNGYDIEIANHPVKGKPINLTVYVWQVRDQLKVIEVIEEIRSIGTLRNTLRGVVKKTDRLAAKKNQVYLPILVQAV